MTLKSKEQTIKRLEERLSVGGHTQGPVSIQLNSSICIIYGIISKSVAAGHPGLPTVQTVPRQDAHVSQSPRVTLGRWQDPGPSFSRQFCFLFCDPQPPLQPLALLAVVTISEPGRNLRGQESHQPLAPSTQGGKTSGRVATEAEIIPPCKIHQSHIPLMRLCATFALEGTARSDGRCENKTAVLPWRSKQQNPMACQDGCRWSWLTPATQLF